MRVSSFCLDHDVDFGDGLIDAGRLARLGKVVVIAGKNGSGKTRLLKRLRRLLEKREEDKNGVFFIRRDIGDYEADLPKFKALQRKLEILERRVASLSFSHFDGPVVNFVPLSTELIPSMPVQSESEHRRNVVSITGEGLDHGTKGTLPYIELCQDGWWNATHGLVESERAKEVFISSYIELTSMIMDLTGIPISRSPEGELLFFGRDYEYAGLSDGQRVLLQFCTALHAQGDTLKDALILMDEPENRLHPAALREVFDKIKSVVVNGQIWVATHSIPLLSHVEESELFFMENGKISHAGRTPERVINDLLGSNEDRQKLLDFIDRPDKLALARFATECFVPPVAIDTPETDPQLRQIRAITSGLMKRSGKLRILDVGAGKGRLARALSEENSICEKFEYHALETSESSSAEACLRAMASIHKGNVTEFYHTSVEELVRTHPSNFDVAILCNVLHEIPPRDWPDFFQRVIKPVLSEDGFLLIVEDLYLPHGEYAHDYGFVMLSPEGAVKFFGYHEYEEKLIMEYGDHDKQRLVAYCVPKEKLKAPCADSLKQALKAIHRGAKEEATALQKKGTASYKSGLRFAFLIQQYWAASAALDDLRGDD